MRRRSAWCRAHHRKAMAFMHCFTGIVICNIHLLDSIENYPLFDLNSLMNSKNDLIDAHTECYENFLNGTWIYEVNYRLWSHWKNQNMVEHLPTAVRWKIVNKCKNHWLYKGRERMMVVLTNQKWQQRKKPNFNHLKS